MRAAEAAEARRLELGLSQKQTGVDPKTWRLFVGGEKWPSEILTQRRIEAHLQLKLGALARIAQGRSSVEMEALSGLPGAEFVPPQLEQMLALLNEALDHYRAGQVALGDLKVGIARGLADQIITKEDGP